MLLFRLDPNVSASPPATLMGLSGSLVAVGGNTAVQRLQQSLKVLATTVNRPAINPDREDGLVDTQTMMAIVQAFNILAEKLPAEVRYVLQAALLAGSLTTQAANVVKAHADYLNVAAQAAILKYTQAPNVPLPPAPGPMGPQNPAQAAPPYQPAAPLPWYKTPGGMLGIGAGALGGILLLVIALK